MSFRLHYALPGALLLVAMLACNATPLAFLAPSPTPTATHTATPSPTPPPTNTPLPTATFTPQPTATFTLPPPPPTQPLPPTVAPTISPDQAIKVFYINKDQKGPYGCGEQLWWVKLNQPKTGNLSLDVTSALSVLLNFHGEYFGELYNPGYASNLSVSSVTSPTPGTVLVELTGTYNKTKDNCDGRRFIDQLRQTIKQFEGVSTILIRINGAAIADVIARK